MNARLPMICTYKGRPISELTREELLVALEHAYGEIRFMRDLQESESKMRDLFRRARNGCHG